MTPPLSDAAAGYLAAKADLGRLCDRGRADTPAAEAVRAKMRALWDAMKPGERAAEKRGTLGARG